MEIIEFKLKNFRNYEDETIKFSPGVNVFQGQNGQGKTNILEGIYYLLTGKSYRILKDQELVRWGEKEFHLYGDFRTFHRPVRLESHFFNKKKVVKINNIPCKKLSDYVGTINVVFFSPNDLVMVKGGPMERRRFLDLHIAQISAGHVHLLNQYNRLIQQKSALLKTNLSISVKSPQLELWNEQLRQIGEKIMRNRWEFAQRLQNYCREIYTNLSSGAEELEIIYLALGKNNLQEAIDEFPKLLQDKMPLEIERKMVLVGPHRDDLLFLLNGKSARLYGSQGQQRSIVLSLKLAELRVIQQEKGEYPILLLDDVLSELDSFRREYLLRFIEPLKQTLITMTSAEKLDKKVSSLFIVDKGRIRRNY